jgi:uncharacterized protein involved in type VI secretion and phage assembly
MSEGPRFYGIYRGTVRSNLDPLSLGRLQCDVPSVPGASSDSWARPCASFAGSGVGVFVLPATGSYVWVQFEEGNPADPIWMGGFWDDLARPPATPAVEMTKMFKTANVTLTITDTPGAAMIELKTDAGGKIVIGPTGIEIDNGMGASIKLEGPKVTVNSGALEVI